MIALFYKGQLNYVEDLAKPEPAINEALIRVHMAGICNTDIEITKGYMNFEGIPGHEFVGTVEAVNSKDKSRVGKRVVGDINCACGKDDCAYCRQGLGRHCPERTTLGISGRNGCFAEYITLPIENLYEVPENIPDEIATLTEPLAAAFEILEQISISDKHNVLIIGDGKLGLLINHALSTTGATISLAGNHPDKLAVAANLGSKTLIKGQLPGKLFDVVIEATGSVDGFSDALAYTKPRGILVLKSTTANNQQIDLTPVVVNEITIVGSRCGLFKPALNYMNNNVKLSHLIESIFPASKALDAFEKAKTKGSKKILIDFR